LIVEEARVAAPQGPELPDDDVLQRLPGIQRVPDALVGVLDGTEVLYESREASTGQNEDELVELLVREVSEARDARPDVVAVGLGIPATIDHYLTRTTHGSTLSAVVHAWVLARAHRDQALDYFLRALESDTHDIQGGTTAEGIHLGAMSGSVDIVQRCFAGVETHSDVLWVNPHWPASLGPLVLDLTYRGQELTLNVTGSAVTVRAAAGPGRAIRCGSRSTVVTLQPGATVRLGPEADAARDRKADAAWDRKADPQGEG